MITGLVGNPPEEGRQGEHSPSIHQPRSQVTLEYRTRAVPIPVESPLSTPQNRSWVAIVAMGKSSSPLTTPTTMLARRG